MEVETLKNTERFVMLEAVFSSITIYFKAIAGLMELINPSLFHKYKELDKCVRSGLAQGKELAARASSLEEIIKFYYVMGGVQVAMEQMADLVKNPYYDELLTIEKSMTTKMQLNQTKFNLFGSLRRLHEVLMNEDPRIFKQVVDSLDIKNNYEKVLEDIKRYETPNKLLIYIVKSILNLHDVEHLIRPKLEAFKDVVLEKQPPLNPRFAFATDSSLAWTVSLYGLIPTTPYLNSKDLLTGTLPYKYNVLKSELENLIDETTDKSLLIINRSVGRNIDYNVLPLVDAKYIEKHKLWTNRNSGLNKLVWRRFDTVREIPTESSGPNFTKYDRGTEDWIVVETTDWKYYRLLGRAFGDLYVPRVTVDKILNGVSMRPLAYHNIQEYYILNRAGEVRRESLLNWYDELKLKTPPTDALKTNMLNELVENFKPEGITTEQAFVEKCREGYKRIVSKHLIKYLEAERIRARELKASFALHLDDIFREFRRKLESAIAKIVHPGLFSKRSDMSKHLVDIYRDIMKETIEDMDSPPSKWQSVEKTLKEFYIETRGMGL
jgi:hypothetical protein